MMSEVRRAKAKTKLTADDKRMISQRKVETGHSEDMVAVWFKLKTGKEIHRSIVGKCVRAGFHEMDIDGLETKRCRRRGPKWPLLDLGLFSWFTATTNQYQLLLHLVAAPPTVSSQPVAATPPVNNQPVIMTATHPVSHQLVTATPPANRQPVIMTAIPPVSHQLVTATPPVNRQPVIMTAIPPVSHQLVTATPPVNNQLMTATPPVSHQPVTDTPQQQTASSNDDLTVDGQLILSNGWLSRWKGRHGVFSVRLHGEAGGADQQGVARAQRELAGIIDKYRPEDVFNIDETGLFYRQAPDRTLTTTADVRGAKKAKDCITVALAVKFPSGKMEIEGAETNAQIAARLMGRDNENRDDESDGEADPNNVLCYWKRQNGVP
ncbi:hypothetical protein EMCRGX_G018622 [Ephydatia muelleri]